MSWWSILRTLALSLVMLALLGVVFWYAVRRIVQLVHIIRAKVHAQMPGALLEPPEIEEPHE